MYTIKDKYGKTHISRKIELVKALDLEPNNNPDKIELTIKDLKEKIDKFKGGGEYNFYVIKIKESLYNLNLDIVGDCQLVGNDILMLDTIKHVKSECLDDLCQMCLIHGYKQKLLKIQVKIV